MGPAMATAIVLVTASQLLWTPPPLPAPPAPTTSSPQGSPAQTDGNVAEVPSEDARAQLLAARAAREASLAMRAAMAAARDSGDLPRVVCGMTVLPADRSADPRMVKAPPTDTRFLIRAIRPPLCVD
jgi:hypothetical protein